MPEPTEPKIKSRQELLKDKVSQLRTTLKQVEIETGRGEKPHWTEVNQALYELEIEVESN